MGCDDLGTRHGKSNCHCGHEMSKKIMTKSREIIEVEMTMTNKGGDIHHTYT
jgi:hypothetical protein